MFTHIIPAFPEQPVLVPPRTKPQGRLRLSSAQVLQAIQAYALATWALEQARRFQPGRLPKGPGGRPPRYSEASILLMAIMQALWRKSYRQIVDWVALDPTLAQALGFPVQAGQPQTISLGQYWERHQALGLLPFLFFFLGLVAQLLRLGVIHGHALIVDSTRLKAWRHADPGAAWIKYKKQPALFGYKVRTVLCQSSQLPLFVWVTPANVHDTLVGWVILLLTAWLYRLTVSVVYADAAYFDHRFLHVVRHLLGAFPAVDYNPRRRRKRQLAVPAFVRWWRRQVLRPRQAFERHFAWLKRYFGLKYFQCYTLPRVTQYVLLTYIATAAVALATYRYGRPDLIRRLAMALAYV